MFSREEYEERRHRLLRLMEVEGLDALVLSASKVESGYVRYYTGYESQLGIQDCSLWVVVPGSSRESTLLTNAVWDEPFETAGVDEAVIAGNFGSEVLALLPPKVGRVGIAPYPTFPAPVYAAIESRTSEIQDVTSLMLDLRALKSDAEIEILKQVAAIADTAADALLRQARPGVSEREIAAEVERALRLAGSGPIIFSTILCSGPRTARVIALPGERRLQNGDLVQLDCGPSLDGYRGDFSRVIYIGEPDRRDLAMCETTALMYEKCVESLRPGVRASQIARDVIEIAKEAGYGPENFYQSRIAKPDFVGHGIGLGNPDAPQLSTADDTVIQAGMVINIEPILRIPGRGGTRIEDAVVVGNVGAVRLSACPIRLWQTGEHYA
jgi:Xaa-Pro aminopeptidase